MSTSSRPTKNSPYCLLVEGSSDQHAIIHLMKRHQYDWDDAENMRPFVLSYDGLANLPKAITAHKAKQCLGIVVDADEHPEARWQELSKELLPIVEQQLPSQLDPAGLIVKGREPNQSVGVWLMPNNCEKGALEDLVQELLPKQDCCWELAREQASAAKGRYGRSSTPHGFELKSQLHTWLAWQEEPGMSFGQALNKKILSSDSPTALLFMEWFLRLFPGKPGGS